MEEATITEMVALNHQVDKVVEETDKVVVKVQQVQLTPVEVVVAQEVTTAKPVSVVVQEL